MGFYLLVYFSFFTHSLLICGDSGLNQLVLFGKRSLNTLSKIIKIVMLVEHSQFGNQAFLSFIQTILWFRIIRIKRSFRKSQIVKLSASVCSRHGLIQFELPLLVLIKAKFAHEVSSHYLLFQQIIK